MIARTILRILTEAYSDEFVSYISKKFPDYAGHFTDLLKDASRIFPKTNQLNWFLRQIVSYTESEGMDIEYCIHTLARFEHYFSLPVDAIQTFSFGSLSIDDASKRLRELEEKWQEKQSRLIPIEKAYAEDSYVVDEDEDEDEDGYGYEDGGFKDSRTVEGTPEDIVTFPDGFRWVNLNIPYSEIEAKAMGHCGNEPRSGTDDTLLSLRQPVVQGDKKYLMPHATFVLMSNGYLRELKGFQNHKLAPKYMPYVVELFKQYHRIHGIDNEDSYRPESDVTWDDFTREQLQDILRSNPRITDGEVRYKATGEDGTYDTDYGKMIVSDGGETIRKEYSRGIVEYYNRGGQLHREDGPAVERSDGTEEWYRNGLRHRDDGPAKTESNGTKHWYRDGHHYRDGGLPAYESWDGTKRWFNGDGLLHREGAPAVLKSSGTEEWYRNGKLHRDDGPAVEHVDGTKMWYRNGERHRDDGPAVEKADGSKRWYRDGKLHRDDGPAQTSANGGMVWCQNDRVYTPTDEEVARYEERIRRGEITE